MFLSDGAHIRQLAWSYNYTYKVPLRDVVDLYSWACRQLKKEGEQHHQAFLVRILHDGQGRGSRRTSGWLRRLDVKMYRWCSHEFASSGGETLLRRHEHKTTAGCHKDQSVACGCYCITAVGVLLLLLLLLLLYCCCCCCCHCRSSVSRGGRALLRNPEEVGLDIALPP